MKPFYTARLVHCLVFLAAVPVVRLNLNASSMA